MQRSSRAALRAPLILAVLLCGAVLAAVSVAAGEGHGIEAMRAKDWKGMWGFEKRGFAECWLAGTRHQAGRTLAGLEKLQQQLGPQAPAAARDTLEAIGDEAKTILECRLTPKQLEESVNRFYEAPGNANVLLGDALHFVVLERGSAQQAAAPTTG
jgi:hypothetical protein